MPNPNVYILQKDMPHVKAGTEFSYFFIFDKDSYTYKTNEGKVGHYDAKYVVDNPEWFVPRAEEPKEFTASDVRDIARKVWFNQSGFSKCEEEINKQLSEKRNENLKP